MALTSRKYGERWEKMGLPIEDRMRGWGIGRRGENLWPMLRLLENAEKGHDAIPREHGQNS